MNEKQWTKELLHFYYLHKDFPQYQKDCLRLWSSLGGAYKRLVTKISPSSSSCPVRPKAYDT